MEVSKQQPGDRCITLHQPWASLLAYGVKRIEGRGWKTLHRGVLWIHAAKKRVNPVYVQEMHALYERLHTAEGADKLELPAHYPTAALVGCVSIAGCLQAAQVEAWEGLPASLKEEVGSPFCFLCQDARRLQDPIPLNGAQGMWRLDSETLQQAVSLLQPVHQVQPDRPFRWDAFPGWHDAARRQLPRSSNADRWSQRYNRQKPRRSDAGSEVDAQSQASSKEQSRSSQRGKKRAAECPAAAPFPASGAEFNASAALRTSSSSSAQSSASDCSSATCQGTPSLKRQHAAAGSPAHRDYSPGDWEASAAEVDAFTPAHALWQQPYAFHMAQQPPQRLPARDHVESEQRMSPAQPLAGAGASHTHPQRQPTQLRSLVMHASQDHVAIRQRQDCQQPRPSHQQPCSRLHVDNDSPGDVQPAQAAVRQPEVAAHPQAQAGSSRSMPSPWQHLLPMETPRDSRVTDGRPAEEQERPPFAACSVPGGRQQVQLASAAKIGRQHQSLGSALQFVPASVKRKQTARMSGGVVGHADEPSAVVAVKTELTESPVPRSYLAVLLRRR